MWKDVFNCHAYDSQMSPIESKSIAALSDPRSLYNSIENTFTALNVLCLRIHLAAMQRLRRLGAGTVMAVEIRNDNQI